MSDNDKSVAVIGAGTMGRGIAQVFAQSGYDAYMFDTVPAALESASKQIGKMLSKAVEKGKMSAEDAEAAKKRLHLVNALSDIGARPLIVEAATEKLEIKIELLKELQTHVADGGILASNTSSISITQLAAQTEHPDRFIGMHFFNPVPLMKLVEVVRGLQTSDDTVKRTIELAKAVGKTPVECNDHPGFVSNRVLMPMINEAIFTLQDGVAEPEAIDEIMKLGMNHPMGPLALADLIGLDVCLFILEVLHRDLGEDRYRPCPLLRKKVLAGMLGRKTKNGFYSYE
ncbi:MAG: 3-hydroxybutyryl-CoA dehydrogenase [Phycisphaerales bacterium]|nr:MAG: 3-hydroxybutyryl-CoA dehydrogenase [Phycisphaerales bacterium]